MHASPIINPNDSNLVLNNMHNQPAKYASLATSWNLQYKWCLCHVFPWHFVPAHYETPSEFTMQPRRSLLWNPVGVYYETPSEFTMQPRRSLLWNPVGVSYETPSEKSHLSCKLRCFWFVGLPEAYVLYTRYAYMYACMCVCMYAGRT
jgi:hypothetical protein